MFSDSSVGFSRRNLLKEGVVVLRAVEGRIEIDEIDRLVGDVAPEDVEIVDVVERAHADPIIAETRRCGKQIVAAVSLLDARIILGAPVDGVAPPRKRRGQERLEGGRAAPG